MKASRFRRFRVPFALGALLLMASVVYIQPALALNPNIKQYTPTVDRTSVEAGSTYVYGFTLANLGASPQSIGSANVTLPSSLTTSATFQLSASQPAGQPSLSGAGTITSSGTTLLQLRNLALAPSSSVTATFTAEAPCQAGTDYTWGVLVKQSNDFSGPPGNDFNRVGDLPTTAVTGTCHLGFVTNPASAGINSHITSAAYNTSGTDVKVAVESGATPSTTVTYSTASVTLALLGGTTGATLGGNSATAGSAGEAGIAVFDGSSFAVDKAGLGYTAQATSSSTGVQATLGSGAGAGPVSDPPFDIASKVADCATRCSVDDTNVTDTAYVVTGNTDQGALVASLNLQNFGVLVSGKLTCPGSKYVLPPTQGLTFDLVGGTPGTKTIKYIVLHPDRSTGSFQACFASTQSFTTAFKVPAVQTTFQGTTYYVGQLPLCKNVIQPAPCYAGAIQDRITKAVTLTVNAPAAGDPWTH
jgi:hypothetical protein